MLVCLIESETNVINPVLGKLIANFPKEYVYNIRSRKLTSEELSMLKSKPLICSQWCIVIHCDSFSRDTALSLATNNFVIWQVSSKATATKIKGSSQDIKIVDNSRVSKDEVVAWIQKELAVVNNTTGKVTTVNRKTAEYLYNRVDGYIEYLIQAVSVLKFELNREEQYVLSKELINRYVTKVSPVKRYHILNIIFGLECKYSKEMVTIYLSRCLYEWKSLKDYLLSEIKDYKTIFEYEMSGELNLTNILEFMKEHNSVSLTDMKVRNILLAHKKMSYERLLFLETFISQIPNDALGACRFCSFVRTIMSMK